MKALVIGASGLVGGALVRVLERSGVEVVAAVRSRPLPGALALDVSDAAAVERTFVTTKPDVAFLAVNVPGGVDRDRKSTRLNFSHVEISYAVFCLKKKKKYKENTIK